RGFDVIVTDPAASAEANLRKYVDDAWPALSKPGVALWRHATGEGQDISLDVRKALRRFCGFYEGKWETINGRSPTLGSYPLLTITLCIVIGTWMGGGRWAIAQDGRLSVRAFGGSLTGFWLLVFAALLF